MSGLIAIMDELGATLEAALDDVQVVPRLNLAPSGLSIDIYPGDPFRDPADAAFTDTSGRLVFTVRARVPTGDLESSQEALLNLMDDESSQSVAVALMDDQTLNGLASSVYVEGPSGYIPYGDNPGVLLGVQWRVSVLNVVT